MLALGSHFDYTIKAKLNFSYLTHSYSTNLGYCKVMIFIKYVLSLI